MYLLVAAAVVVSAVAYVTVKTRPPKHAYASSGVKVNDQSYVIPGTYIRRSHLSPNKLVSEIAGIRTLYEAFQRGCEIAGPLPCFGVRQGEEDFVWESYNVVKDRVTNFASGLLDMGVAPGQSTFVGVYSNNRPEWIITEQACNSMSQILVPLYDTLGADAVRFIVNQAEISVIVADPPKIMALLNAAPQLRSMKFLVKMGAPLTQEEIAKAQSVGVQLSSFLDVEKRGKSFPKAPVPPRPEDIATICYTSGTTGDPKGAMLTHGNLIADLGGIITIIEATNVPKPAVGVEDAYLSYLPLAHMLERLVATWMTMSGARIGFFRGDIKLLMNDISTLRPTLFASVPRLLNRVYDKVVGQVETASPLRKKLFYYALAAKEAELKRGIIRNNSIWDKLVFHKVQKVLGGRLKLVITGAAPISKQCLTFLRCAFGCPVLEGYGQTENSAGATLTLYNDTRAGVVGAPIPCGEIKLDDVPDMKYFAKDNKGEICLRGPHVMKGYLKNPERTAEAIDREGWLHTGDIGEWTVDGALRLIDRKKAIFKLAQGEYIAPEKIENVYIRAPSVAQAFVYGHSLEATLVAVVVPDIEAMPNWLKQNVPSMNPNASLAEICASVEAKAAIMKEILDVGKKSGLQSFEQVRKIFLQPELFSVENNLLTPTFKAKRPQLQERFQPQIDAMYAEIHAETPPATI